MKFQLADSLKILSAEKEAFWFVYHNQRLLIREDEDGSIHLPFAWNGSQLNLSLATCRNFGFFDGYPCYWATVGEDGALPPGFRFERLRSLFGRLPENFFSVAGLGLHLAEWDVVSRFCSVCASPLHFAEDERAKFCESCQRSYYPVISPAVIVAVIRDNKILLARSARYPKQQLFSVIAGYVEPGETLEACVQREVMEEVGIRVKNICYFDSQPWPYSGSLMVGFTAEYAGGEIEPDGKEIVEADWYTRETLPQTPAWGSIAGQLVEWFKKREYGRIVSPKSFH